MHRNTRRSRDKTHDGIARDRGAAARKLDPKIVDPLDDDSHVSRGALSSPRRRRDRLGGVIVGPVHAARSIDQPLDDGRSGDAAFANRCVERRHISLIEINSDRRQRLISHQSL